MITPLFKHKKQCDHNAPRIASTRKKRLRSGIFVTSLLCCSWLLQSSSWSQAIPTVTPGGSLSIAFTEPVNAGSPWQIVNRSTGAGVSTSLISAAQSSNPKIWTVNTSVSAASGLYTLRVASGAYSRNFDVVTLVTLTPTPTQTIPTSPPVLSAQAGNAKVFLSWTAPPTATIYLLYYSTSPSGPFTAIANTNQTSVVHQNLINGTTYYYYVKAYGSGGYSDPSAIASARPLSTLSLQGSAPSI